MSVVDRSETPALVLFVIGLLALSATAATIGHTVGGTAGGMPSLVGGSGGDTPMDPTSPPGDNGSATDPPGDVTGPRSFEICLTFLTRPLVVLGIVGAMAALFYGIKRRRNAAAALMAGTGVVPVVMGAYFFLTNCASGGGTGPSSSPPIDVGPGTGLPVPQIPPAVLGVALVGVLGLSAVVLYSVTGREEAFEPIEADETGGPEPEASDFAAAAGRAADRIEEANVAVDNAVYRAWFEMTQLLDLPDPETSSPQDFADAAIEAGLDEDDVTELTDLFTAVRYGHRDAGAREERALAVLRRVEAAYEGES